MSLMLKQVAHDFRNPLNCIISMLDLIKDKVSLEVHDNYVRPALSSSQLLLNLANDIVDMAQIKVGKFKLVRQSFELK